MAEFRDLREASDEKSQCLIFLTSGAECDNNHAHPDTSMKLGRNVH